MSDRWRQRREQAQTDLTDNRDFYRYSQDIQLKMKEPALETHRSNEKVEVSVHLDSDLFDQIKHLTNDPSKVIEVAIRQWLKGSTQRDDELTRTMQRTPVPPRGEWND